METFLTQDNKKKRNDSLSAYRLWTFSYVDQISLLQMEPFLKNETNMLKHMV